MKVHIDKHACAHTTHVATGISIMLQLLAVLLTGYSKVSELLMAVDSAVLVLLFSCW